MLLSDLEDGKEFDPIYLAQRGNFIKVKLSKEMNRALSSQAHDMIPVYNKEYRTVELWHLFVPIYDKPLPAELKDGVL